jgi:hypothetical protein
VRILEEGVTTPLPFAPAAPSDVAPRLSFTDDQIAGGLPERGGFPWSDLRCQSFRVERGAGSLRGRTILAKLSAEPWATCAAGRAGLGLQGDDKLTHPLTPLL